MRKLAETTGLGRESLHKTLSAQGNPEFKTLEAVLGALAMRFSVVRSETEDSAEEPTAVQDIPQEALQAA